MRLGTPMQQVGAGLVVVVAFAYVPAHPTPPWQRYDVLADPLGWLLVVRGTAGLVRRDPAFATARWLAVLAGVLSVPLWLPQVHHRLDASGQWAASLPQLAFCLALAHGVAGTAARQQPRDAAAARSFGLLVWAFAVAAVLPVLALGGGLRPLEAPAAALTLLADLVLVYQVFRVHRRAWLGGPGPAEPRAGSLPAGPGTREGRPPSGSRGTASARAREGRVRRTRR